MYATDSTVIGPPLAAYRREPEVERQLAELRAAPRSIPARIAGRDLQMETLVAVARSYVRSGAEKQANRVLEQIGARVSGRIRRHIDVWGVRSEDDRDDLIHDILAMLLQCVRSLEPDQEFWECRFWVCFDRRSRSLLRNWSQSRRGEASLDDVAVNQPSVLHSPEAVSFLEQAAARQALASLPEPLRTAFYLKHLVRYKEESRDAAELTIACAMGVSGRTVRNYLERADALLAHWRGSEPT